MRRRIVTIACCLLVGIVLTYAIAWALTFQVSWRGGWSVQAGTLYGATEEWLWKPPAHWRGANQRWTSVSPGGEYVEVAFAEALKPEYSLSVSQQVQRRRRIGWPLLALESRQSFEIVAPSASTPRVWKPRFFTKHVWINTAGEGLHVTGNPKHGQINLPMLPRWPHFGASVLLYGSLAWGALTIPGWVRRSRRRRHGRCTACNYELGGVRVCPECGRPAPAPPPPAG